MSRKNIQNKKLILLLASGVLALAGYLFSGVSNPHLGSKKGFKWPFSVGDNYDYNNVLVKRVVDGDTLKLENGEYVRLLGIDTPEMHESAKLYRDARRSGQSVEAIKQIKELEQLSRRIDKIVEAIATVSIQTNLLAVNGAIEAARAGEYGKGFVVVSNDIRNLARDSAENADRIKDLVKGVQDQITAVSNDLTQIVDAATIEVEQAKMTTKNLNEIEAGIIEIDGGTQQILNASIEIAAAIGQAKRGIEQISTAAQEAEKAVNEAAAAAVQQSKGAEELASAIEEISSLADELQSAA